MRPLITALLLFVSPILLAQAPAAQKSIERDVRTLAAPEMEGRGLGTTGIRKAADYIEKRLREIGLQPAFGKRYRQPFPVKVGVASGPRNRVDGLTAEQWSPLGFSSSGAFGGEVVFAGYGIEAPPLGYRELDGVDLKGKVALILRYEPQEKDDASIFDGRRPSRWSAQRYKVLKARERGAVAVIFATGPLQDEGLDRVPALRNDGPESPAGIPVIQVKTSVAQRWLAAAGMDLTDFQKSVDRDLRPRSKSLGVRVSGFVDVKPEYANAENVVGVLPGRGALAGEVVVLGAHYDHLGYGGEGSMKPNVRAIHPGADDNASGTAGVLSAAEMLVKRFGKSTDRRTIVFALFSGEERGLAGSAYFVEHPAFPIEKQVAMVNLDMIGAMREDSVTAFGTESAAEWTAMLDRVVAGTGIKLTKTGDGYGPSDQTSFYAARVPVLHFFTGAHDRYHAPDDVADPINFTGIERITQVVASVVESLARGEVTPRYARAAAPPAIGGDTRTSGAYLGTVPDFSAMDQSSGGVLLADVRPGSPADKAGIRGKDRLVEIGGTRIENLYDMTYALQDHKPGDTVDIVVVRGGDRISLRATLTTRGVVAAAPAQRPAAATPAPVAPAPVTPAPVTVAPSAPAAPTGHGTSPAPQAAKVAPFYEGRPGKDFVIGAGKPFDRPFEGEAHLRDIRQLTFGGENAEAYFSPDGKQIIFQSPPKAGGCDQQFTMDLATGAVKMVSSGKGRTTCGYYRWPQGDRIIYASTEAGSPECPPRPSHSDGYVWPVYPAYDLFEADVDGSNARRITTVDGYDAEMTWCHRGGKKIFTSMRDGDLDLYEMDETGNVKRLTDRPGYDGGAFYNSTCTEIVWRAHHPQEKALEDYRSLLARNLVKPLRMELFVMNADGSNSRQITDNGAANFCPYFTPDDKRIIFASNVQSKGFEFDLWLINKDGSGLERVTTAPGFDGFPVFSPDGQYIIWSSGRANPGARGELNLFIAKWVD